MFQLFCVPRPTPTILFFSRIFSQNCLWFLWCFLFVQSSSRVLGQGKEKAINEALHLFAGKELRRAYGGAGNSELTSLGTRIALAWCGPDPGWCLWLHPMLLGGTAIRNVRPE